MALQLDAGIENGDAFAIPDLYKGSNLAHFDDAPLDIEEFQPLDPLNEPHVSLPFSEDLKTGLLELPTFEYGPVEDVGVLEDSSVSSLESLDAQDVVEEDLWTCLQSVKDDRTFANVKSWETFYDKRFQEPKKAFLSEGGARIFDAAIVSSAKLATPESCDHVAGHVVQSKAVLSSLAQLALGRESLLYYYNAEENSFRPRKADIRMSGYSLDTFNSLSESLRIQGNRVRNVQEFVAETQRSSTALPSFVSLASAFIPILASLEAQIGSPSAPIRSLLQLQSLVGRPSKILECLSDVIAKVQGARTDEELVSKIYNLVQDAEHSPSWLSMILQGLLMAASRPWLESVDQWLGLEQHNVHPNFPAFAVAEEKNATTDAAFSPGNTSFEFDPSSMPTFVSAEDASTIFETGRSLRLLESHQSNHPLATNVALSSDKAPKLGWQFSWRDIESISEKAKGYEKDLRKALKDFASDIPIMKQDRRINSITQASEHTTVNQPIQSAQDFISTSTAAFEAPLPNLDAPSQTSSQDLGMNCEDTFAPPLSLLSALSFNPVISAQAHLINHATLHLLFKTHHLSSHFTLLHRFPLMSDGPFSARLSHALFSPSLPTAERLPNHHRSGPMGLKLGTRDTWPPASSELRLALMGTLTDSYSNSHPNTGSSSSMFRADLPGGLSFAIREMSEEQLRACMDPHSISALDFLRLQYQPPAPLNAVITPSSLSKYDRIFQLRLRCTRLLFVVTSLSRTNTTTTRTHRRAHDRHAAFRIECHHFISTLCAYFSDSITTHWHTLSRHLQHLELIAADDGNDSSDHSAADTAHSESIPALRAFHERVLDRMLFSLLLRRRQSQVMGLLEEIFGLVLRFAWLVSGEEKEGRDVEIAELYERFGRKTRVFVDVLRGLSERRGFRGVKVGGGEETEGEGEEEEGVNTMGLLLLRFEMNGFYRAR